MVNIQSARNVAEFVHVLARDSEGRPTLFNVPGHEGRQYKIELKRNGGLQATCRQFDRRGYYQTVCKGNQHCVCYHVLASCTVAASEQGKELSWCESQQDAERLSNIEGKVFTVKSSQSGKLAYGVVRNGLPTWEDTLKELVTITPTGLDKTGLIELAIIRTENKEQWYSGESVWLAPDAFLKNEDGFVRLYRVTDQKYPRSERLAVIFWLDPGNVEAGWQRYTAQQAHDELFDKDDALLTQHTRGRDKLFKT